MTTFAMLARPKLMAPFHNALISMPAARSTGEFYPFSTKLSRRRSSWNFPNYNLDICVASFML